MLGHRARPAVISADLSSVPVVGKKHILAQLRFVAQYLVLLLWGAVVTFGQFMAWTHVATPWREVLLIASAVLEYTVLTRLSDWMYFSHGVDELVEWYREHPVSTERVTSEAPEEAVEPRV